MAQDSQIISLRNSDVLLVRDQALSIKAEIANHLPFPDIQRAKGKDNFLRPYARVMIAALYVSIFDSVGISVPGPRIFSDGVVEKFPDGNWLQIKRFPNTAESQRWMFAFSSLQDPIPLDANLTPNPVREVLYSEVVEWIESTWLGHKSLDNLFDFGLPTGLGLFDAGKWKLVHMLQNDRQEFTETSEFNPWEDAEIRKHLGAYTANEALISWLANTLIYVTNVRNDRLNKGGLADRIANAFSRGDSGPLELSQAIKIAEQSLLVTTDPEIVNNHSRLIHHVDSLLQELGIADFPKKEGRRELTDIHQLLRETDGHVF